VRVVDGEERVAELARMLAGSDTSTAREHAAELLADAAAEVPETPAAGARRRPAASPRKSARKAG
jgi:DNA repair protein RecN (Recombination protein N)